MIKCTDSDLTDEELLVLHKVETLGKIEPMDREVLPGLHFCAEWDGLAIFNKTPEWELCICTGKPDF